MIERFEQQDNSSKSQVFPKVYGIKHKTSNRFQISSFLDQHFQSVAQNKWIAFSDACNCH